MSNTAAALRAMKNGASSLARGNLREAEAFFERALYFDRNLLQADLHLAQVALRLGNTAKAGQHVDHVLAVEPGIAHAHYLKARILARKGERGRALYYLKKAVGLFPDFEAASRFMFLLFSNPDWTLREIEPPDSWKMAVEAGKEGDLVKMRYALLDFAATAGTDADSSAGLFKAYCMLSHYEKACELLALLTSSGEARSRCHLFNIATPWNLGYSLPESCYLEHARKLEMIKPRPRLKDFMAYLKCTLSMNFQGPEKASPLTRLGGLIEEGSGKYDFARYITGWNSLNSGQYDKAAADFQNMLFSGYRHLVVYCRLGEALLCKGGISAGLEQFKTAYSAAPKEEKESVLTWEGEMRLFMKQYRRAVVLLKNNSCHYAACWLGAAYLELGELKNALIELKKAVAVNPDDIEARTWLGEAYRRCGRRREALCELETAGRLSAGNGSAFGGKGRNIWVYLNKVLLFADSADTVKMKRNFALAASAWPELMALARKKLGIGGGISLPGADIVRITAYTLKLCGGYRRTDRYFFPLLLLTSPAGTEAAASVKGKKHSKVKGVENILS